MASHQFPTAIFFLLLFLFFVDAEVDNTVVNVDDQLPCLRNTT